MKKTVFAGDWTMEKVVGVQRYASCILTELDKMIGRGEYKGTVELLIPRNADWKSPYKHIHVVRRGTIRNKAEKHLWQQLVFPAYVRGSRAVGVDLAQALPVWGCDICAIHDCIHETFPENFADHSTYLKIYLLKARIAAGKKSRIILTPSRHSAKEIQRFYHVPQERLRIVGNGWEHMKEIKADEGIFEKLPQLKDKDFFFALGSRYRHKNHEWIIRSAVRNPAYYFVVTGSDSYSSENRRLADKQPENLIYTGYISDGEVKALYQKAKALIQPSLYEGFGIPPLEALSVGGKAIVSNASCLPEIYGDSVYYIDPHSDGADMDEVMKSDISLSQNVLDKYTWSNAAKTLAEVIRMMNKT
ncbi:MAG: glycosyltransferase family 4 protein [Lachnospiraceae bacterium]|nr:glycosyltransferase family 4 protein [Lachnospiraceae bacterium]